jgi:dTDP-4-dehydrorhamnose 3,5-epimerase
MQIERFPIDGVLLITPTKRVDPRGFFSEVFRKDAFAAAGVDAEFVQDNQVFSAHRGVLRGMHFQAPPHAQGKLVRCIRGVILDVAVDIRQGSPTFGRHVAVELSASNFAQLWVPPGFAHGYLTLETNCEVIYKVTDYWAPDCEKGLAWNDPEVAIDWGMPEYELTLADKDRGNPCLNQLEPIFHFRTE